MWSNSKCLIAGGAGFLGSHLAKRLIELGAEVTIADNLSTGRKERVPPEADFYEVDLRGPDACRVLCQNQDYVFHLAANMGGIGYITFVEADVMSDNLRMNTNMLEGVVKAGVKRFFYSSSACVYPVELQTEADVTPLKEEDAIPGHPLEGYGWEKLVSEELCRAYQSNYGLETRIARYHNVYGPGADYGPERGKAVGSLCRKAIRYPDDPFVVWGDGKQTRSFLYVDDCIDGTLKLMESDYNKPVNIGSDRLVVINELADMIIDVSGKKVEVEHDLGAPQGVRGRNADLTLVKRVLGWSPKVSLEEGVRLTYAWIEEDLETFNRP